MDFQQVIIYTSIDIPNSYSAKYETRQSNHSTVCCCLRLFGPLCVFAKPKEDKTWNNFLIEQSKSIKNNVSSNSTSKSASLQNEYLENCCKKKKTLCRYKILRLNFRYMTNIKIIMLCRLTIM